MQSDDSVTPSKNFTSLPKREKSATACWWISWRGRKGGSYVYASRQSGKRVLLGLSELQALQDHDQRTHAPIILLLGVSSVLTGKMKREDAAHLQLRDIRDVPSFVHSKYRRFAVA